MGILWSPTIYYHYRFDGFPGFESAGKKPKEIEFLKDGLLPF
jgi:hypothetical protein